MKHATIKLIAEPKRFAAALRGLGISQSYASELVNRKREPSLKWAVKIEAVLGIPPRWWFTQPAHEAQGEDHGC